MSSKESNDFLEELAKSLPNDRVINLAKKNGSWGSYYLHTWGDNVWGGSMSSDFQKMYNEGDGRELLCKACAIHSSSMLAYNFFHWINNMAIFKFRDIEFDRVFFEVKIPCLKKPGAVKKIDEKIWNNFVCANMDVMLAGKHDGQPHVFFLESKFTEHFSSASSAMRKIKSAYYDKNEDRYIVTKYDMPAVVEKFRDKAGANDRRKAYYDGIKQSICHLIAITNLIDDQSIREAFVRKYNIDETSTFHFANLLYSPAERFKKERNYYEEYCKLYDEFYASVDRKYPEQLKVEPKPLSYMKIWSEMKDQVNQFCPHLKEYLEARYMNEALTGPDSGNC